MLNVKMGGWLESFCLFELRQRRFTLTLKEPHYAEFTSQMFLNNSLCHYPLSELPRNVFLLSVAERRQFLFTALESQTRHFFMGFIEE